MRFTQWSYPQLLVAQRPFLAQGQQGGGQQLAARLAAHLARKRAKKPIFFGGQQGSHGSQHGSGAGSQHTGSGAQQGSGAGSQQGSGAGSQQGSGAGSQQTGSGSQQTGSGSQQTGSGSQHVGSGQHSFFFKQSNKPASAEGVAAATTTAMASRQQARTRVANFIIKSSRGKVPKRRPDQ